MGVHAAVHDSGVGASDGEREPLGEGEAPMSMQPTVKITREGLCAGELWRSWKWRGTPRIDGGRMSASVRASLPSYLSGGGVRGGIDAYLYVRGLRAVPGAPWSIPWATAHRIGAPHAYRS
jgi:hypothetical protein